jgi:arylsulfatase
MRAWWTAALVGVTLVGMTRAIADEPAPSAARAPGKLNVIVLLADDLGFSDVGCYGSEIPTPNIDRLAKEGMRFTSAYNTARCWPTRASIMTGLYPHRAGIAMNMGPNAPAAYRGEIARSKPMLPELLRARGYRSLHVGKWHLSQGGQPNDTWATGRGFDRSLTAMDHDRFFGSKGLWDGDRKVPQDPTDASYATDTMNRTACDWIRASAADPARPPFFLYLAWIAPHFPLHAPAASVAKFRGKYARGWDAVRSERHRRITELGLTEGPLPPNAELTKPWDSLTDAQRAEQEARVEVHAAMIHHLDLGVGMLLKTLEETGQSDKTLILFLSDNGASAESLVRGDGDKPGAAPGSAESFKCLEPGWASAANAPLRMSKMWTHEGGIATPLIAWGPEGVVKRGAITRQPAHVIDLVPTVLDLVGVRFPKEFAGAKTTRLDGISLAGALRGDDPVEREFFWEHIGNKALRQGNWKLVAKRGQPWELYDLAHDRSETNDLAPANPEQVTRMAARWQELADDQGVVPPEKLRPAGKAAKKAAKKAAP